MYFKLHPCPKCGKIGTVRLFGEFFCKKHANSRLFSLGRILVLTTAVLTCIVTIVFTVVIPHLITLMQSLSSVQ
jgi:hypothetical protein